MVGVSVYKTYGVGESGDAAVAPNVAVGIRVDKLTAVGDSTSVGPHPPIAIASPNTIR